MIKFLGSRSFCNIIFSISCINIVINLIYVLITYGVDIEYFFDGDKGAFPVILILIANAFIIYLCNKYWNVFYKRPQTMFVKSKKMQTIGCKLMKVSSIAFLGTTIFLWNLELIEFSPLIVIALLIMLAVLTIPLFFANEDNYVK